MAMAIWAFGVVGLAVALCIDCAAQSLGSPRLLCRAARRKGSKHPGVEVYGNAGSLLRPYCGHARLLVPDDQRLGADLRAQALHELHPTETDRGDLCAASEQVGS